MRGRTLEITTNIGCRINCSYCPQSTLVRKFRSLPGHSPRILTAALLEKYLATVPRTVDIHFSGYAEPWHAPECTDMVLKTSERGHRIAVFTTTDGMTALDVESIKGIPFKRFVVHLVDQLGEMRLKVDRSYLEMIERVANSSINNLEFMTLGIAHREVLEVVGEHTVSRRIHSRAGNVSVEERTVGCAQSDAEIRSRSADVTLVCRQDRMLSNVLLPNGEVQFCAMDYGLTYSLGNLSETSYEEVANGQRFWNLIEALRDPKSDVLCRSCEYAVEGFYVARVEQ